MCDYSLEGYTSRKANVGEKLTVQRFPTGSAGCVAEGGSLTPVCLIPGTVLTVTAPEGVPIANIIGTKPVKATFVQVTDQDSPYRDRLKIDGIDHPPYILGHFVGATIEVLNPEVRKLKEEAAKTSRKAVRATV